MLVPPLPAKLPMPPALELALALELAEAPPKRPPKPA